MNNRTLILACLSGTAIEWLDLSLFGVLAAILANSFFPNDSDSFSLIKTFGIFATGFLIRPLGSLFWGYYGDRIGRRKSIILTVVSMTLSTTLIGILPTYNQVGLLAPVFLIFLRIAQGFSASGEQAGVITYLYEKAPPSNKNFMASLPMTGVYVGMSLAIILGLLINLLLSEEEMVEWGWRIPFLMSFLFGLLGYFLRIKIVESNVFQTYLLTTQTKAKNAWIKTLSHSIKRIGLWVGLFQLAVVIPYIVFVYIISYSISAHQFDSLLIYFVTFVNLLITAACVSLAAHLSQKYNIKLSVFSIGGILIGCLFIKGFYEGNIFIYAFLQLYFGIFTAMLVGPFCADVAKAFTMDIRCTALALCINVTAALFGGLTPIIMATLQLTKSPMVYIGLFMMSSCLLAILSELIIREKPNNE